jgi:hypothetical protein
MKRKVMIIGIGAGNPDFIHLKSQMLRRWGLVRLCRNGQAFGGLIQRWIQRAIPTCAAFSIARIARFRSPPAVGELYRATFSDLCCVRGQVPAEHLDLGAGRVRGSWLRGWPGPSSRPSPPAGVPHVRKREERFSSNERSTAIGFLVTTVVG